MKQNYSFYIPSLSAVSSFEEITIGQYKSIIQKNNKAPFLNIGFNLGLLEVLQQNNTNKINFTGFDKYIIAYQLRCFIFEKEIKHKEISYPPTINLYDRETTIICTPPTIEQDIQYFNYISSLTKEQTDELLLAETSKYIDIGVTEIEDKIIFLKTVSVQTLANCVSYIDNIKASIKDYYIKNNGQLIEYGVKLLLP